MMVFAWSVLFVFACVASAMAAESGATLAMGAAFVVVWMCAIQIRRLLP